MFKYDRSLNVEVVCRFRKVFDMLACPLPWASFAGDLGQSFDSNKTLNHYEMNPQKGQTLLFVGDLSYADNYPNHDNVRWDTWGRFTERSTAYQPWIWTAGNHEIDFAPELVSMFRKFIIFPRVT